MPHPNIVAMWDTFETKANVYLFIEYVEAGRLLDLLTRSSLSGSAFHNRLSEDHPMNITEPLLRTVH